MHSPFSENLRAASALHQFSSLGTPHAIAASRPLFGVLAPSEALGSRHGAQMPWSSGHTNGTCLSLSYSS